MLLPLMACATSKPPVIIEHKCPIWLKANPLPEPIAPETAVVNEEGKDFMAAEYFPWAKTNYEKLKRAQDWCLEK